MKKILSVSVIAMLAVSPMMAFADPTCPGVDQGNCNSNVASSGPGANGYSLSQSATGDDTNVVTASYVKGAYNDAITKINKVAADATAGITNAAGSGLVPNGSALDINLTTNGGLAITSDALNVVVDGSTVTKGTGGALQVGTITDSNVAANAAIAQSKISGLETALGNKQAKLQYNDGNAMADINSTVVTTIGPATGDGMASDANLATEKAVRTLVDGIVSTDISAKQDQLKSGSSSGSNMNAVVVDYATGIAAANSASDTKLASEKAIRAAIDGVASATMEFTNKTFDANGTGNSISNLEVGDFASGVVQTSVRATSSASDTALASEKAVATALAEKQGSLQNNATTPADINTQVLTTVGTTGDDTHLVTEKAVRDAITTATSGISGKQAQLQYDNSGTMTDVNTTVLTSVRATGTADNAHMVSEKAVRDLVDAQRISILTQWGAANETPTKISLTTASN